jgi:signal transduction histidine kinase
LVVNAADAMGDGGRLTVTVAERSDPHPAEDGAVRRTMAVTFADTGCGIPTEDLRRIFDPFFTTKDAGKGTGLGLSVSYRIVTEHGGWFDVQSEVGQGTSIVVNLPVEPGAADPEAGGPSRS